MVDKRRNLGIPSDIVFPFAGITVAQRAVNNFAQLASTSVTATNQNSGGNESRPKNANVNYIVKV